MKSLKLQSPKDFSHAGAFFFMYCVRNWVFVVFFLLIAAFAGFFHPLIVGLALICAFSSCIRKYKKYKPHKSIRLLLLILICIALVISLFFTPHSLTGRDQGTLAQASIALAQNHSFPFSTKESNLFFTLYGPGTALNFPGFDYRSDGMLQAHFPAPYIVWMAAFYTLFGMAGFVIAHTITLLIFLYAFALILRILASPRAAIVGTFFVTTSFPILWIYKNTLSENFMLALVWSVVALSIFYFYTLNRSDTHDTKQPIKKNRAIFYSLIAATALLALTRVEGVIFALITIAIILSIKKSRTFIKKLKHNNLFIFSALLIGISSFVVLASAPFYKNIAKALLHSSQESATPSAASLVESLSYNLSTLTIYGTLPFLVCGIAGIMWLLYKKNYLALVPLLIAGPILYYLANAHISSDHPWMLRRYTFALIPLMILYSTLFFFLWKRTHHSPSHILSPLIPFFIWAIILFNFNITAPLLNRTDHKQITSDLSVIAQHIGDNDLILVDRLASGDPWALLSGPLRTHYNLHAAYLFDPADINRIDHNAFDRVFLITPQQNIHRYEEALNNDQLQYRTKYILTTSYLERRGRDDAHILPQKKHQTTRGVLYEIHYAQK